MNYYFIFNPNNGNIELHKNNSRVGDINVLSRPIKDFCFIALIGSSSKLTRTIHEAKSYLISTHFLSTLAFHNQ